MQELTAELWEKAVTSMNNGIYNVDKDYVITMQSANLILETGGWGIEFQFVTAYYSRVNLIVACSPHLIDLNCVTTKEAEITPETQFKRVVEVAANYVAEFPDFGRVFNANTYLYSL